MWSKTRQDGAAAANSGQSLHRRVWQSEQLYFDHDGYYQRILKEIESATRQIDVEMYIFEPQGLGATVLHALRQAAERDVQVRILMDGIGSANWSQKQLQDLADSGIDIRIYHPMGRVLELFLTLRWLVALSYLNRRDHRKMVLVDQSTAFVGSMNLAPQHLGWRETGVRVTGEGLMALEAAFDYVWQRARTPGQSRQPIRRLQTWMHGRRRLRSPLVKANHTRALRRAFNRERFRRIELAQQRVWITSAYFVPSPKILWALLSAADSGCEVKLLLPKKSDVPFVKWLGQLYYQTLLSAGIQIHEYIPAMMHAKTLIIDDWFVLGTCNLNHRSMYRDLELDLVMTQDASKQQLLQQYQDDLSHSETVTTETLNCRSWIQRIGGRVAWLLKSWM